MPNIYWLVDLDGTVSEVDSGKPDSLGFARDFHLSVLSSLDESRVNNLHFYICLHPPVSLPRLGTDVVLVILGDEYHISLPYFKSVLAVLRCYGSRPKYLDGLPNRSLSFLALLQFAHKSISHWKQLLGSRLRQSRVAKLSRVPTLHIPLGCFSEYQPYGEDFATREIDFAFLGSVGTSGEDHGRLSLRAILPPPKIQARREMIQSLTKVIKGGKWNGVLQKTTTFADSTSKLLAYNSTMAKTKISVCPRGSNYETYRFYESCRSGCVIICEPLPDVWFYKGHPGIVIKDWTMLPQILDSLLSDPARLETFARASRAFWDETLNKSFIARRLEGFLSHVIENNARIRSGENSALTQRPVAVQPEN